MSGGVIIDEPVAFGTETQLPTVPVGLVIHWKEIPRAFVYPLAAIPT
jgi:hypothetical protein